MLGSAGFFARVSHALARSQGLPLFALYLGAGLAAIGFAVAISTVTGIFFMLPASAFSDVIDRNRRCSSARFPLPSCLLPMAITC